MEGGFAIVDKQNTQRTIFMSHHPDAPEPTRFWLVMRDGELIECTRLREGEWAVPDGTDEEQIVAARTETPFNADSPALSPGQEMPGWHD